MQISN